jgi:hypothetical protein
LLQKIFDVIIDDDDRELQIGLLVYWFISFVRIVNIEIVMLRISAKNSTKQLNNLAIKQFNKFNEPLQHDQRNFNKCRKCRRC